MAPYDLSDEFIEGVRAKLPELPDQKAARFAADFGLTSYDARHLATNRATCRLLRRAAWRSAKAEADGSKFAKPLANLIINDVAAWLNAHEGTLLADTPLTAGPGAFACEDACG
ncbi:MAG: hypothetical protein ACLTDR_12095 [Adlercreutzia equolifaciens]